MTDPFIMAERSAEHFLEISINYIFTIGTPPSSPGIFWPSDLSFMFHIGEILQYHFFSVTKLQTALSLCHKLSPRCDVIPYRFLLYIPVNCFLFLVSLFYGIWHHLDFPSSFAVAVVFPVLKSGKEHMQAINHCPSLLAFCICKVLEKMVNERLV